MNIKTLAIVFITLAVIYAIQLIMAPKGTGNMPTYITSFKPDDCNRIVISPKENDKPDIILQKRGNNSWTVSDSNGQQFAADSSVVNGVLKTMSSLAPIRLATQNKDRWKEFNVTDSTGIEISMFKDDDVLANLFIGRFTYTQSPMAAQMAQRNPYMRQNPGTMSTYVRNTSDSEVYAVEGFLSSQVGTEPDRFRDKSFFSMDKGIIQPVELAFSFPGDSSFVLKKTNEKWKIGDLVADSASVVTYLRGIRNLRVSNFANVKPQSISHKLIIKGQKGTIATIEAELTDDSTVISSSQYPENMALDKSHYLFDKLFVSKNKFLKN
ncbi:DUF4340 domain-containing protein [Geofilum sp. OHC36d9]|uniref:DUF4340 domain-containing protein n=1 Tax=Geofilum sp. OHC36d9 TaxID=3458413 RepID=UPI00403315FB